MAAETDEPRLVGEWLHSHEEDEDDQIVFRPASFAFPPARGRTGFTLRPGGVAEMRRPGPDDRPTASTGRWRLEGKLLTVETPGLSRRYEVKSIDEESLVVRRA